MELELKLLKSASTGINCIPKNEIVSGPELMHWYIFFFLFHSSCAGGSNPPIACAAGQYNDQPGQSDSSACLVSTYHNFHSICTFHI